MTVSMSFRFVVICVLLSRVDCRLSFSISSSVFHQYGVLDYRKFGSAQFPMFAIRSSEWNPANRMVLVTGA